MKNLETVIKDALLEAVERHGDAPNLIYCRGVSCFTAEES
jgi:hypothetical protein